MFFLFLTDLLQHNNILGFGNFKSYLSEYKEYLFVFVLDFAIYFPIKLYLLHLTTLPASET